MVTMFLSIIALFVLSVSGVFEEDCLPFYVVCVPQLFPERGSVMEFAVDPKAMFRDGKFHLDCSATFNATLRHCERLERANCVSVNMTSITLIHRHLCTDAQVYRAEEGCFRSNEFAQLWNRCSSEACPTANCMVTGIHDVPPGVCSEQAKHTYVSGLEMANTAMARVVTNCDK